MCNRLLTIKEVTSKGTPPPDPHIPAARAPASLQFPRKLQNQPVCGMVASHGGEGRPWASELTRDPGRGRAEGEDGQAGARGGWAGEGRATGRPSGQAVFSVQPRNGRLKFLVLRLEKNASFPHDHIDHAQYFPNKNQAHKLHPQIYTHLINSLGHQGQRAPPLWGAGARAAPNCSAAACRRGPAGWRVPRAAAGARVRRAPAARLSASGESTLSRGSGISGFRTRWS